MGCDRNDCTDGAFSNYGSEGKQEAREGDEVFVRGIVKKFDGEQFRISIDIGRERNLEGWFDASVVLATSQANQPQEAPPSTDLVRKCSCDPIHKWECDFHDERSAQWMYHMGQPQEKAQPEPFRVNATTRISPMRECGLEIRCTEPHGHTGAHSWSKAMAEKAAQVITKITWPVGEPKEGFIEGLRYAKDAAIAHIRSLASTEPPQPELGLPRKVGDKFVIANGEMRFLAQVIGRLDDVPPQGEAEKEGRT